MSDENSSFNQVKKLFQSNATSELSSSLVKSFLEEIKTLVNKEEWIENKENSSVVEWVVLNAVDPQKYLYSLVPISIKFIENHQVFNKIVALNCFDRLISDCWFDLVKTCSNDLIFFKMRNLLYFVDDRFADLLFTCVLKALVKYGNEYQSQSDDKNNQLKAFTRQDEVLMQMLTNIQMDSCRKEHLQYLSELIQQMQVASLKHSKKLVAVLSDLLTQPPTDHNVDELVFALHSLKAFVTHAWIRTRQFIDVCLLTLIQLDCNVNDSEFLSVDSRNKLRTLLCECVNILKLSDLKTFPIYVDQIIDNKNCMSAELLKLIC